MAGSRPFDPSQFLTLVSGSRPNYVLIDGGGSQLCNAYVFDGAESDSLTLGSPFTGNLKVMIAGLGTVGLHPDILAGIQGTFTASVDPVNEPMWNQFEISATAIAYIVDGTFSGRVAYAKDDVWYNIDMGTIASRLVYSFDGVASRVELASPIPLTGECVLSGVAQFETALGRNTLMEGDNNSVMVTYGGSGHFEFKSGIDAAFWASVLAGKVDGETFSYRVEVNEPLGTMDLYIDEVFKGSRAVTSTGFSIERLSGKSSGSDMFTGYHYDITVCDEFFAVDDGWSNNPIIINAGTGGNATLINGMEGDWYDIPL